jgi:hypothetical protein
MLFPELRAAIADIATFMDDDEDPNFDAAQQRAIDCYRDEMLPMCADRGFPPGRKSVRALMDGTRGDRRETRRHLSLPRPRGSG